MKTKPLLLLSCVSVLTVGLISAFGYTKANDVVADSDPYVAVCDTDHRPDYGTNSDWCAAFPIRDSGNYGALYASYKGRIQGRDSDEYAFSYYSDKGLGNNATFGVMTANRSISITSTSRYGSITARGFTNATSIEFVIKLATGTNVTWGDSTGYWGTGNPTVTVDANDSNYSHYLFSVADSSKCTEDTVLEMIVHSPTSGTDVGRVYVKSFTVTYNC